MARLLQEGFSTYGYVPRPAGHETTQQPDFSFSDLRASLPRPPMLCDLFRSIARSLWAPVRVGGVAFSSKPTPAARASARDSIRPTLRLNGTLSARRWVHKMSGKLGMGDVPSHARIPGVLLLRRTNLCRRPDQVFKQLGYIDLFDWFSDGPQTNRAGDTPHSLLSIQ